MHDGRAATLHDAITLHGGQGQRARERFLSLNATDQFRLIAFLETLRAPNSTANCGDRSPPSTRR
jgi:CxxC motif-containing protein (DUF1111 family)